MTISNVSDQGDANRTVSSASVEQDRFQHQGGEQTDREYDATDGEASRSITSVRIAVTYFAEHA